MFRDLETERLLLKNMLIGFRKQNVILLESQRTHVIANISVDNTASIRTALKLGFVRSGEQYYEEFHGQKYLHDIYVKKLSTEGTAMEVLV